MILELGFGIAIKDNNCYWFLGYENCPDLKEFFNNIGVKIYWDYNSNGFIFDNKIDELAMIGLYGR